MTLGTRITQYRKSAGLTQEALAEALNVSPQAVSKWENDISCPDIATLPKLSKLLHVSVDTLLSGQSAPETQYVPEAARKKAEDMMMHIYVDSAEGDKVRVNLPLMLVKVCLELGMEMPQISGNDALKGIDLGKVMELAERGLMGKLVEVESADGDTVVITVE